MKKLKEGVLLTYEEYADYESLLAAFAALRPATSFQNTTPTEVKQ